jgi:hypothetical protein
VFQSYFVNVPHSTATLQLILHLILQLILLLFNSSFYCQPYYVAVTWQEIELSMRNPRVKHTGKVEALRIFVSSFICKISMTITIMHLWQLRYGTLTVPEGKGVCIVCVVLQLGLMVCWVLDPGLGLNPGEEGEGTYHTRVIGGPIPEVSHWQRKIWAEPNPRMVQQQRDYGGPGGSKTNRNSMNACFL